jgi:hypothetical protein
VPVNRCDGIDTPIQLSTNIWYGLTHHRAARHRHFSAKLNAALQLGTLDTALQAATSTGHLNDASHESAQKSGRMRISAGSIATMC